MKSRRRLIVDSGIFIMMFQSSEAPRFYSITKNALPDDAEVVSGTVVENEDDKVTIILEIESESFTEETPNPLPAIEVTQLIAILPAGVFSTGTEDTDGR